MMLAKPPLPLPAIPAYVSRRTPAPTLQAYTLLFTQTVPAVSGHAQACEEMAAGDLLELLRARRQVESVLGFADKEALRAFYDSANDTERGLIVGLSFESLRRGALHYTIWLEHERAVQLPPTLRGEVPPGNNASVGVYSSGSFVGLQHVLNLAFRDVLNKSDSAGGQPCNVSAAQLAKQARTETVSEAPQLWLEPFPQRARQIWYNTEGHFLYLIPLYITIAFVPSLQYLSVAIVDEKERKLREALRIMNCPDRVYWATWLLTHTLLSLVTVTFCTMFIGACRIFPHTDDALIFAVLMLYNVSQLPFAMMLAVFCDKAKNAATLAGLVEMLMALCVAPMQRVAGGAAFKMLLSLFSPMALAQAIARVLELEVQGVGATWHNCQTSEGVAISIVSSMGCMCVGSLLLGLLGAYLGSLLPGEHSARPSVSPLALCAALWRRRRTGALHTTLLELSPRGGSGGEGAAQEEGGGAERAELATSDDPAAGEQEEEEEEEATAAAAADAIEALTPELQACVQVRLQGLGKVFPPKGARKEEVVAVRGLSAELCEGQIYALLGHNGAGKTTAVAMLTASCRPSSGGASVYGVDVGEHAHLVREMLGVCPQGDILFEQLTCLEHLTLYGAVRGVRTTASRRSELLERVGLQDKAGDLAAKLSGGQKRSLSVAIALVGDPRFLVLDEPSAGMDPGSSAPPPMASLASLTSPS